MPGIRINVIQRARISSLNCSGVQSKPGVGSCFLGPCVDLIAAMQTPKAQLRRISSGSDFMEEARNHPAFKTKTQTHASVLALLSTVEQPLPSALKAFSEVLLPMASKEPMWLPVASKRRIADTARVGLGFQAREWVPDSEFVDHNNRTQHCAYPPLKRDLDLKLEERRQGVRNTQNPLSRSRSPLKRRRRD